MDASGDLETSVIKIATNIESDELDELK
jgi:hypothetical protein